MYIPCLLSEFEEFILKQTNKKRNEAKIVVTADCQIT